jgi:hypothetical protein
MMKDLTYGLIVDSILRSAALKLQVCRVNISCYSKVDTENAVREGQAA